MHVKASPSEWKESGARSLIGCLFESLFETRLRYGRETGALIDQEAGGATEAENA